MRRAPGMPSAMTASAANHFHDWAHWLTTHPTPDAWASSKLSSSAFFWSSSEALLSISLWTRDWSPLSPSRSSFS
jgi:hypothetical protein